MVYMKKIIVKIVLFIFKPKYYYSEFSETYEVEKIKSVDLLGINFQYIHINGEKHYSITRKKLF